MTDRVPMFPGKPAMVGAKPDAEPWAKRLCPELTAGEIARTKAESLIVGAGVQPSAPPQGIVCQGPQCSLFMEAKQADGTQIAGCARVFAAMEANRTNQMLARFLDAMTAVMAKAEEPKPQQ